MLDIHQPATYIAMGTKSQDLGMKNNKVMLPQDSISQSIAPHCGTSMAGGRNVQDVTVTARPTLGQKLLICVLVQGNWRMTIQSVIDKCFAEELIPGLFPNSLGSAHHKFFRVFVFTIYLPSCFASRQRFASTQHLYALRWKPTDLRLDWETPEANDRPVICCFRSVVNRASFA
jgi:hypothetical protein